MFKITFLISLLLSFAFPTVPDRPVAPQDPLGGLTLGAALKLFADQVKEIEEKAIGGGMVLEIKAGGEVALAIQQAQAAYAHSLNLTWAQLQGQEQTLINSLSSTVKQFLDQAHADAKDIETRAIGIIHDLPFSKSFPQLFSYDPAYTPQTQASVVVHLSGDFLDITRPGFNPTLTISGHQYQVKERTNTDMSFELPIQSLAHSSSALSTNYATITVPYRESFLFGLFHKKLMTQMTIPVVVLPPSAGVVTLSVDNPSDGIEEKTARGGNDAQISDHDDIIDGGEHADLAIHSADPDSGWTVEPNTVSAVMTHTEGDWTGPARNLSTPSHAVLTFITRHHGLGTSGKIYFYLTFKEQRHVVNHTITNPTVTMSWGDTQAITIPSTATWTAHYTRFDGKSFSFTAPYDDKFLSVSQSGSVITFKTIP